MLETLYSSKFQFAYKLQLINLLSQLLFPLTFLQIKVWDVEKKKCTKILMGHTGSVKSLSPHPANPGRFKFSSASRFYFYNYYLLCLFNLKFSSILYSKEIIVSGSRDGSFALWDMRCKSNSKSRHEELCIW